MKLVYWLFPLLVFFTLNSTQLDCTLKKIMFDQSIENYNLVESGGDSEENENEENEKFDKYQDSNYLNSQISWVNSYFLKCLSFTKSLPNCPEIDEKSPPPELS